MRMGVLLAARALEKWIAGKGTSSGLFLIMKEAK